MEEENITSDEIEKELSELSIFLNNNADKINELRKNYATELSNLITSELKT